LPDSAKPEPEMPIHENEIANIRRYPIKDRVRPKYLDDYVTRKDVDDVVDGAPNCTIDFCHRITNAPQSYHPQIPVTGRMPWMKSSMHYVRMKHLSSPL